MTSSFPLPATRADPTEAAETPDNQPYTKKQVRHWLANWRYLESGRFPPDERITDPRARGRVSFESKPPAPAILVYADLRQAIQHLPPALEEVVDAVLDAGNFGRAARWLRRRKKTVIGEYDEAVDLIVVYLSGTADLTGEQPT